MEALVIPDLPLDEASGRGVELARESGGLALLAAGRGVSLVPMATPTSTDERLDLVAAAATSFVYCVAVTGVTGARSQVGSELPALLARLSASARTRRSPSGSASRHRNRPPTWRRWPTESSSAAR